MNTVMAQLVARILLPASFVMAIAVLVKGYTAVGDGFSAGVIAAGGILVQYLVFGARAFQKLLPVRFAMGAVLSGLMLALLTAFVPALLGSAVLTHFPRPGEEVIHIGLLELHTAVLFDLGIFLLVLGFVIVCIQFIVRTGEEGVG